MQRQKQTILKKLLFGVKSAKGKDDGGKELTLQVLPEEVKNDLKRLKQELIALEAEDTNKEKKKTKSKKKEDNGIVLVNKINSEYVEEEDNSEKSVLLEKYNSKVAQLRRLNRILYAGENIPDPIFEFDAIPNLPENMKMYLDKFGITDPSPIQMQAIPTMLQRRDVLCCAPTGSGKTLAFIIPILIDLIETKKEKKTLNCDSIMSIVLEPTRELAAQTYKQFLKYGSDLDVTYALFDSEELPEKVNVLITTPNRLIHHLEAMDLSNLRWLLVDESDRLFEVVEGDSRSFRTQLGQIYKACCMKSCKKAFFSATFSGLVENWCRENLTDFASVFVGQRNSSNKQVVQKLIYSGSEHGKIVALRDILLNKFTPSALIFVQSKQRCRELSLALSNLADKIPFGVISSEKTPEEREIIVNRFRLGDILVLICTELMGRGLDLKNVNMVINFDLPTSTVSYIHRVGRTGRAGRAGESITFFTDLDLDYLLPIANIVKQAGFEVPEYTLKLKPVSRNDKQEVKKYGIKRKQIARLPLSAYDRSKVNKERSKSKTDAEKKEATETDETNTPVGKKRKLSKSKKASVMESEVSQKKQKGSPKEGKTKPVEAEVSNKTKKVPKSKKTVTAASPKVPEKMKANGTEKPAKVKKVLTKKKSL